MKTPTNSKNRPGRRLLDTTKVLLPLLAAGTLASCGTHSVGTAHTNPPAANSQHQFQVQHHAPREFPRTEPADYPTAGWHDSRLTFGDSEADRSLIPVDILNFSW